ncbi:glycosyltransferase family 61 protein [Nitrospirillum sp. BR 11164]|uniref:glycosyltransferase family 61 protein n=1 Tax=Nitrospirillum sp. BR 11164 TaxID=3104324 RepID=UPI002AFE7D10|nr:glycosyltransferase family 61 protein [Nitrospirillum sp. BR 11164]MEA1649039.1 glycosyltransferase family 61 protein [Nitrospirillum sp. BR 11164]
MNDSVSLIVRSLESIVNGIDQSSLEAAGITRVNQLSPRGSYSRRPMALVDAFHIKPEVRGAFDHYRNVSEQFYPQINATTLADAHVAGQGTVVTRNGILVEESAIEYLAHRQIPEGFRQGEMDRTFAFAHPPSSVVETPCILVKRPWYRNYGHWLVDSATILAYFAQQINADRLTIVVGSNESQIQKNIVQETINKICPGAGIIEMPDNVTWRFSDLLYITPLHRPPMIKWPPAMAKLKAAFVDSGGRINPGARLYLSRADVKTRTLANEDALKKLLDHFGFRTVFTSGMSLTEQAQLLGSAEVVMGVKGAALANLVFCQPEATAICLSPGDFIDPFFWDVAGQLGMTYAEIFGRVVTSHPVGRNDFVIEPERLEGALRALLG